MKPIRRCSLPIHIGAPFVTCGAYVDAVLLLLEAASIAPPKPSFSLKDRQLVQSLAILRLLCFRTGAAGQEVQAYMLYIYIHILIY